MYRILLCGSYLGYPPSSTDIFLTCSKNLPARRISYEEHQLVASAGPYGRLPVHFSASRRAALGI